MADQKPIDQGKPTDDGKPIDDRKPIEIAFWLLVFVSAVPALAYLSAVVREGIQGGALAAQVYFRGYYGVVFLAIFVIIAWISQHLAGGTWRLLLGLPALFIGVYPAMSNFGSEKLVRGAVVAFDLEKCPEGWTAYSKASGRVIVGAGQGVNDERDRPLSLRNRGEIGGEEKHLLTEAEMPSHTHVNGVFKRLLQANNKGTIIAGDEKGPADEPNIEHSGELLPKGGSQPHNTMPPFRVLTMCEKQ